MKSFILLNRGNNDDANPEDEEVAINRNRFSYKIAQLFLPDSNVRIIWDVFIFMVIWYNSVITPIRIFIMSGHDSTPQALISLDVVFDFIFVADTILRFYRPYVDGNTGQIIMDPQLIRSKYMGSFTFYINSIACIPITKLPISLFLSAEQQGSLLTYFNVFRMIRVLHLPGQFQELKQFKERKGPVNEPVFRMYVILFFMILFMCQCGCLYFGVSTLLTVDDICPAPDNFVDDVLGEEELWVALDTVTTNVMDTRVCGVEPSIECEDCPQTMFFTRSLYFLMQTIFTIGYGDTVVPSKSSVEMVLGCVFMLFGVVAYALTIANMTSVLANLDVVNMQFRHEMDTISHWMAFRSLPIQLKQQISTFFSYLSRSQHGVLDEKLLGELPPRLRTELAESNIELLSKIPFFNQNRSDMFLSLAASALKRRVYTSGSFIIHQAEMQRDLVIIKSGKADILLEGVPDAVGSLLPGDFIGDYQLLFGTVNQVSVRAVDYTEALVLTFAEFQQVMSHPHNHEFNFAKLGGTFRQSDDDGCIETIYETKENLKKLTTTANTILGGKSRSKLKDMMAEHEIVTKEFRILPNSKVHLYWDVLSIASILYYSIDAPIRIASSYRASTLASSYDYGFIVGYCIDAMFIVDMILRASVYAYSSYEHGRTIIVTDKSQIRQRYLSSGKFKIDLLAIAPFDLIAAGTNSYHSLFRLSKLVRVSQIPQAVSNLQKHLDACLHIKTNETQRSVLLMLLYSLLLVVWSSAGWNALRYGESGVISVYWAITTLSTVGYGDVTPGDFVETVYALMVGAVGAVFTAAVVANVTSFFHDAELSEHNYEHQMNCIKRFVERHKISHDSSQRVLEYFDYVDQEQDGLSESVILREAIPDHLASNVLIHITQPMVEACDFFADCEVGLTRKIMTSLEQVFFGAQCMVIKKDVPSNGMYFIKKGLVHLMKEDEKDKSLKIIRKLDANDSFAEGCLVEYWERNPFLAKTVSECELWTLKRSVFQQILVEFPRSRTVLNQIKTKQNDEQYRRRASVHDIKKAAERAKRNATRYIHPHSLFIQGWFGVILGVTLYSMIVLPFRVAFLENHEISPAWVFFDYLGDCIFLVDFIFRSTYEAFFDENNNLIVEHKAIWQQFLKSGKVKWHILSMMPFEVLTLAFPTLCPLWRLQTWSLFRLNKLARMIEMPSLIRSVESSLAKIGVKVPKNPLKVVKLLLVIALLAHINSCVFFAIANFNQHANSGDLNAQRNWANAEGLVGPSPTCPGEVVTLEVVGEQYTAGLYWAMATISTAGYGDITADLNSLQEILYSTLILIVGMLVYTLVIASLEDIVAQLDVTSSLYKMKTDRANTYAQIQCLPESLKGKIGAYNDQLWRSHLGVKGDKLLKYISPDLKTELIQDMAMPYLEKAFFLKDCNADFVHYIMQCLELELYQSDDYLFHEGERGDAMHIVISGSVDLLTSQGVKFKTVSYCTLGETSFFLFEPQICSAKAADPCEVFQLSMMTFLNGLDDYRLSSQFREYLAAHHSSLQEAKASIENTIHNLRSQKMVKFLDANDDVLKVPKGVVLPDSNFRVVWDIFLFIGLLYLIISIPIQISFSTGIGNFVIDLIVDAFFVMDMYNRLRKFAVVQNGYLVTRPSDFGKLYRQADFRLHLVCAFPASFLAFVFFNVRNQYYGLCRLLQFLRVVSFARYLEGVTEIVSTKTRFTVTTAALRLTQIFMVILILTHWFSCAFHFIGDQGAEISDDTWIIVDEMQYESLGRRYLRSFYWSLYTITTIGYGSVSVISIQERLFSMFCMAVGAVICDAGLTAVLASILQNKDKQAGTNNRRIQCTKLFMATNDVDERLQSRIIEYFAYADDEMRNIDETDILNDLSSSLRCEVLSHFSFDSLRDCAYFDDISDGALLTLIQKLEPYLAVTGEKLSVIGEPCYALYVFQKGSVRTKDATGSTANVAEGDIIGHLATLATSRKEGLPTHSLEINLISANFSKSKNGNPYVIVKNGRYRCRSLIKSTRNWMETIDMKVRVESADNIHKTELIVKEWRKRQNHVVVGFGDIVVTESSLGDVMVCPIHDDRGRNVGSIELRAKLCRLSASDVLTSHEMTATALNFSHLYRLPISAADELRSYLELSRRPHVVERIPIHGSSAQLDSAIDWELPISLK
jgi:CRP-like cAMP-binding protein